MAIESAHELLLLKFLKDVKMPFALDAETPSASVDKTMVLEIFQLLYALSKEVESFTVTHKSSWPLPVNPFGMQLWREFNKATLQIK